VKYTWRITCAWDKQEHLLTNATQFYCRADTEDEAIKKAQIAIPERAYYHTMECRELLEHEISTSNP
jgi:hypothetical protein